MYHILSILFFALFLRNHFHIFHIWSKELNSLFLDRFVKVKFQENPDCIKHDHQDKILINPGSDQQAKIGKNDKHTENLAEKADKENLVINKF